MDGPFSPFGCSERRYAAAILPQISDRDTRGGSARVISSLSVEIKWDGVRAIAYVNDGGLRLVSRNGLNQDRQYPELSVLPHFLRGRQVVLDGEIAALDEKGRPSFERIQPRIMETDPNAVAQLARSRPVIYFVFDLLYLDGYDLRRVALAERRKILESIFNETNVARLSRQFAAGGAQLLEAARQQGLEGIVAKRASSLYLGTRSRDWVKIKVVTEQDFVICGYTEGERDFFGALVLGAYDKDRLVWTGNVGTGFDRKAMERIRRRLDLLRVPDAIFPGGINVPQIVHWTRPETVCTVRFVNWTSEKRLRAPVFVGIREDVPPRDCRLEPDAPPERAPLLAAGPDQVRISIEGHAFQIRNLNKVFYPAEGYTKRDVLNYYDGVAPLLIPHWRDRPLSLRRYPDGISKEGFFQKRAAEGFPDWMRTELIKEDGEPRHQVIGAGRAELIYLANLGCIDQNPWMSRVGSLENPDFVLIDLDPYECGYDKIVEAAQLVRRKIELLGLEGYPKTTGGDGLHIYIPVEPVYSYEQTRSFAEILARLAAAERPDLFTTPRAVARREPGKVYFDYLQNGRGKTISAPYVLRAYPGAPVATPLEWREVAPGLRPGQFHIGNALNRFDRVGDLFAGVLARPQRLEPALERLARVMGQ